MMFGLKCESQIGTEALRHGSGCDAAIPVNLTHQRLSGPIQLANLAACCMLTNRQALQFVSRKWASQIVTSGSDRLVLKSSANVARRAKEQSESAAS